MHVTDNCHQKLQERINVRSAFVGGDFHTAKIEQSLRLENRIWLLLSAAKFLSLNGNGS